MVALRPTAGERFGRLTVLADREFAKRAVPCRCDCGAERVFDAHNLLRGTTRSCGCLQKELTSERKLKHGSGYENYRYQLWRSIKKRCFTKTYVDYPYYGGRGITMAPEWVHDFPAFADWLDGALGERPADMTLDRINNDGNYEPGNLRWATRSEQALNRRNRWRLIK